MRKPKTASVRLTYAEIIALVDAECEVSAGLMETWTDEQATALATAREKLDEVRRNRFAKEEQPK